MKLLHLLTFFGKFPAAKATPVQSKSMKTSPIHFSFQRWIICFCLVMAVMTAHCQPFGGIISYAGMNFSGNNVTIDSFNSADPNHSIWQTSQTFHGTSYGVWSDTLSYSSNSLPSRTADATIATDGSVLNVANANIYGYLDTAPGGVVSIGNNGSVGDLNWVHSGTSGIEPGHAANNMNQVFSSKSLPTPTNSWQNNWIGIPAPGSGAAVRIGGYWTNVLGRWTNMGGTIYTNLGSGFNIGGIVYHLVITNTPAATNYIYYAYSNTLNLSTFVDAPKTVIYLPAGVSLSGATAFTINTNADCAIYSGGNITVSATAEINNLTQYVRALSIYDLAGNPISMTFAGSGINTAYIYAPSSSITFSGGGSSSYGFVGAIFCYNLAVNGHYNFHIDESLFSSIPPWIVQQPASQFVEVDSNATFNVSAYGPSLNYQWFFATTNYGSDTNSFYAAANIIRGATNSSLTITNVQFANAGYCGTVITNTFGSVQSAIASLIVYTDATPVVSGMLNPTNGQFQFNVTGAAGLPYTVEASTNLVNWVPLWTNTAPFNFADTNINDFPQRFYRSVFIQ